MKIYKFYPEPFVRMYFVAEDFPHAQSMGETLLQKYIKSTDWIDEDEVNDIRSQFFLGFADLVEDDCMFIDWHY